MKTKIGNKEVIGTAVLQVPDGEDAWIEFIADKWDVRINVRFEEDSEIEEGRFTLVGHEDHAVLILKNWNSELPSATTKPFSLGKTKNKNIYFMFSGFSVKGTKRIDITFLWGAENE